MSSNPNNTSATSLPSLFGSDRPGVPYFHFCPVTSTLYAGVEPHYQRNPDGSKFIEGTKVYCQRAHRYRVERAIKETLQGLTMEEKEGLASDRHDVITKLGYAVSDTYQFHDDIEPPSATFDVGGTKLDLAIAGPHSGVTGAYRPVSLSWPNVTIHTQMRKKRREDTRRVPLIKISIQDTVSRETGPPASINTPSLQKYSEELAYTVKLVYSKQLETLLYHYDMSDYKTLRTRMEKSIASLAGCHLHRVQVWGLVHQSVNTVTEEHPVPRVLKTEKCQTSIGDDKPIARLEVTAHLSGQTMESSAISRDAGASITSEGSETEYSEGESK